jgi:hypothetical protein
MESLTDAIHGHEEKIRIERSKDRPDEGLISHWEKEIRAFRKGVNDAKKRLGRKE